MSETNGLPATAGARQASASRVNVGSGFPFCARNTGGECHRDPGYWRRQADAPRFAPTPDFAAHFGQA